MPGSKDLRIFALYINDHLVSVKSTLLIRNESWKPFEMYSLHFPIFFLQAVFDPEIFFYVLLPPIIFYAGYDMKKVITKWTFVII